MHFNILDILYNIIYLFLFTIHTILNIKSKYFKINSLMPNYNNFYIV